MNGQHPWVGPSDVQDIRDVEAMAEALVVLAEQIGEMLANVARVNRRLDSDAVMATLQSQIGRTTTSKRGLRDPRRKIGGTTRHPCMLLVL
jgi:hypothetical protein